MLNLLALSVYRKEILFISLFALFHSLIFHFPELSWLAAISLVPLFLCLSHLRSWKEVLCFGYLGGFLWTALTFFWVVHVTFLGFLVLCAYLSIYPALFCVLVHREVMVLKHAGSPRFRHGWIKVFTVAGLWVFVEYLRSNVPVLRFPWALFGYSQWQHTAFIQSADHIGTYGLSFLLAFLNAGLYAAGCAAKRLVRFELPFVGALKQILIVLGLVAGAVGGNVLYGVTLLKGADATISGEEGPKISVVQGNIPQHLKWNPSIKEMIFQKYEGLSRQVSLERPDLIIWPETAFPGYWEDEPEMAGQFSSLAADLRTYFLIGAPTLARISQKSSPREILLEERRRNSALYFNPSGKALGRYHKLRLVPFGEYVPAMAFLRRFYEIGRFSPGNKRVIFDLPYGENRRQHTRFSVLICFEDIFPDLCRAFVGSGSEILINITNDAWFRKSSAPYQHAQASVLRAVENRVPVVRAANTGLSCFIDSFGRIRGSVTDKGESLFVTGYHSQRVGAGPAASFYQRWGDVFLWACLILAFLTYPLYFRDGAGLTGSESSSED